jgi:hypothetical protein
MGHQNIPHGLTNGLRAKNRPLCADGVQTELRRGGIPVLWPCSAVAAGSLADDVAAGRAGSAKDENLRYNGERVSPDVVMVSVPLKGRRLFKRPPCEVC